MSLAPIKRRTYEVLEGTRGGDRLSQAVQWFIVALIVLNVSAFVMATVPWLGRRYAAAFLWFERVSVAIFTAEYLLRVWACTEDERYAGLRGRLRFMVTPAALVDLLAIVPFYLPRVAPSLDLRALRALRLFRLLRLLKLGRFSQSLAVFSNVLTSRRFEILIAFIVVAVMLVFASSLMYVAEHRVQPEAFSSIPAAMWWGAVTLTTVGYGDVTPVTTAGRILGGIIAVLGIGLFALPAGILSSGFEEALETLDPAHGDEDNDGESGDDAPSYCPHCGEPLKTES